MSTRISLSETKFTNQFQLAHLESALSSEEDYSGFSLTVVRYLKG
jgi:hypothetical protein